MKIILFERKDQEVMEEKGKLLELECIVKSLQMFMKNRVSIDELIEFQKLEKMSDIDIYNKYQYVVFDRLRPIVRNYICRRYDFHYCSGRGIGIPIHPKCVWYDECLGRAFDRFRILENQAKKSVFDRFSESELTEILIAVTEEINVRKAARNENK